MEYFDVVDINKNKTNKVLPRGENLQKGEYNVGVEVWIITSNNELLITQRSPLKSHPLQWEVPGGCLIAGETSVEGAVRELKEEIGLDIDIKKLHFITTSLYKYQFVDIFTIKLDVSLSELTLQNEEISDARLVSLSEFLKLNSETQIVPSVFERYNLIKHIINKETS